MKFETWFSESRLDFWLQHYLRYKFAKQLILPLNLPSVLSLEHSISSFFDLLAEELGKVESFYCRMERMQREKWASAMDRLQAGSKSNRQMQVLQETCEGIYMALSNLSQFSLTNYRGFMHLVEKERLRLKNYARSHPDLDKFEELLHAVGST
jgi:SPX domain protein involved in polyphosphate accumulation